MCGICSEKCLTTEPKIISRDARLILTKTFLFAINTAPWPKDEAINTESCTVGISKWENPFLPHNALYSITAVLLLLRE